MNKIATSTTVYRLRQKIKFRIVTKQPTPFLTAYAI